MKVSLLCFLFAIAFESSADCQIKGGEWLQEAQIESTGWGMEIGHLMINGPVLPSGQETVFVKWREDSHPSGPTVYSLLKLPTLQQVWSFGSTDSWGLEFSSEVVTDFNGDGFDDILVGLEGSERVWLLDGLTGAQLFEITGPVNSEFGHQVFQVWDVDSDGIHDWGIYSPKEYAANGLQGMLYLYSGISGSHIRTLAPSDLNRGIGSIFASAQDWDGDGFGDFFCWDYYSQLLTGMGLLVRSGLNGAILHEWNTDYGIATMLSIPGFGSDPKPQVITSHPGKDSSGGLPAVGVISLYNRYSPDYLWTFEGKKSFESLGVRIVEIPDFDFDGEADLIASSPFAMVGGNDETGLLRIISSTTGSQIKRVLGEEAYEEFGFSLIGGGSGTSTRICVGSPGWTAPGANYPYGRIQCLAFNPQLTATPDFISISQGGTIQLQADFPSEAIGDLVFPVASRVGIGSTTIFGLEISIASGPLLQMGLTTGYPLLVPRFGYLNAQGDWSSTLDLPPSSRSIAGQDLFVVAVHAPFPFVYGVASTSYPVHIRILP